MWLCTQSWHSMYSNTPRPQLQPFHTVNAISKPIAYSPTIYRSTSNPYTHMHAIPQNAVPRDCAHSRDIGVLKFKCTRLSLLCAQLPDQIFPYSITYSITDSIHINCKVIQTCRHFHFHPTGQLTSMAVCAGTYHSLPEKRLLQLVTSSTRLHSRENE